MAQFKPNWIIIGCFPLMIISLENPAFHRSAMTNFTKIFGNFFALTNFLHLEIEWAVFSTVVGGCYLNSRRWLFSQQS
jgi:hypothetical protein